MLVISFQLPFTSLKNKRPTPQLSRIGSSGVNWSLLLDFKFRGYKQLWNWKKWICISKIHKLYTWIHQRKKSVFLNMFELCRINLWARGAAAPGPAPRGGPAPGRCFWIKERKKKLGEKKREKKEKGGKEGEKEKGKVKEIVFRTNKLTERFPCWSMERFWGPMGAPHPWLGPGPRRCLIRPRPGLRPNQHGVRPS